MVKKKEKQFNKGGIVIYKPKVGDIELRVKFQDETIWLTQTQIAELFNIERSVITKHLKNIFKSKELNKNSACAKIAHTASDGKIYKTQFYNLDVVISVGYRVNSQRATQFRIWATDVLRKYLTEGYAVNQKELLEGKGKFNQLKETVDFLQKKSKTKLLKGQEKELLNEKPEVRPRVFPSGIIFNEVLPSPEGPDSENEWTVPTNKPRISAFF